MNEILLTAAIFLASAVAALAASSVPANGVISSPGEYYLNAHRSSNGSDYILLINASNVTLEMRNYILQCTPPSPASQSTFGIIANNVSNIKILGGRHLGCVHAISIANSHNVTIEGNDLHARYRTISGAATNNGLTVRGNVMRDISGYNSQAYAIGIDQPGSNCTIENNAFRNLHRQAGVPLSTPGGGVGIILSSGATGCSVRYNTFRNENIGTHLEIGVWVGNVSLSVSDNSFTNIGRAIAASPGYSLVANENRFWMQQPQTGSYAIGAQQGLASENVIIGYDNPIQGNIPEQDNLILP